MIKNKELQKMATCNQDLQYGTEIQFFLGRQGIDKRGDKEVWSMVHIVNHLL